MNNALFFNKINHHAPKKCLFQHSKLQLHVLYFFPPQKTFPWLNPSRERREAAAPCSLEVTAPLPPAPDTSALVGNWKNQDSQVKNLNPVPGSLAQHPVPSTPCPAPPAHTGAQDFAGDDLPLTATISNACLSTNQQAISWKNSA